MPFIARPKRAWSLRERLTLATLVAAALYTAMYPNIYLTAFAAIGLGAARISRPRGLARTLSIRGVLICASAYLALLIIAIALAASLPPSSKSEEDEAKYKDVDFDSIIDPSWNNLATQYVGFIVGAYKPFPFAPFNILLTA